MKIRVAKGTRHFGPPEGDLLRLAKSGHNQAVIQLLWRYGPRLRTTIRRILAERLRNLFDPDDLIQDIAVSLLAKPLPIRINTPADFARYVGGMARNIALALNRKHLAGRHHTLYREVPLAGLLETDVPASPDRAVGDVLADKESEAVMLTSLPTRMLGIVAWICAGYSAAEIATMSDIEEETVVMFVCAANNCNPHRERKIDVNEALRLFKPRGHGRRKKSIA